MRKVWLAIGAIAFALSVFGPARGGELPADFLSQYAPAAARLQQAYQHATLEGTYSLAVPQGGKPGIARSADFALQVDGARMSLDETNLRYFTAGQQDGLSHSREWLITAERAFSRLRDNSDPWEESTSRDEDVTQLEWLTQIRWLFAQNQLEFFRSEDVTIDSVEESVRDGRPITTVACHYEYDHEGETVRWDQRYDLSPSEGWAIRRCTDSSTAKGEACSRFVTTIDYDGLRDGVPLVKQIDEECSSTPDSDVTERRLVDFTKIEFGTSFGPASPAESKKSE